MYYKLIIAPDPYRLELLVNEYIKKLRNEEWCKFIGPPQCLGHEQYSQALETFNEDSE